jgi:hypothetical protein
VLFITESIAQPRPHVITDTVTTVNVSSEVSCLTSTAVKNRSRMRFGVRFTSLTVVTICHMCNASSVESPHFSVIELPSTTKALLPPIEYCYHTRLKAQTSWIVFHRLPAVALISHAVKSLILNDIRSLA